jgi:hypothetical protein
MREADMRDFARLEVHEGRQILAYVDDHKSGSGLAIHIMRQFENANMYLQIGPIGDDEDLALDMLADLNMAEVVEHLNARYAKLFPGEQA